MTFQPNPKQMLILWRLLSTGGEEYSQCMKPDVTPEDRKALVAAGLIAVEKRPRPGAKTKRPLIFLSLTDLGWQWAAEHLDAEVTSKSNAAGPILQRCLGHLKRLLEQRGIALLEVFAPPKPSSALAEGSASLSDQVRSAYRQLSQGRWGTRVRLADLRDALALPRDTLDRGLLDMEARRQVVLFPLDNPLEITARDTSAALDNSVGHPRHVVYINA